jgi:general nucleoside transport system ATP-binding protein
VIGEVETKNTSAAELARMMVGRDVLLRVEKPDAAPTDEVLSMRGVTVVSDDKSERLRGIDLQVRAGEIVGIAGVEGNGQTELIESIAGLVSSSRLSGTMNFGGHDITKLSARERKDLGISHIPEDRHRRGLLLDLELTENSILGVQHRPEAVGGRVMINSDVVRRHTEEIVKEFDVRPPNPDLMARSLSGGNQQKLIIGREFKAKPKLLLVSQPTRGVDIGAIEFIHRKLIELRDSGCAILLVSSELEEVTALADRLLVINEGRIVGEVNPKTASREELGLMMTGGRA